MCTVMSLVECGLTNLDLRFKRPFTSIGFQTERLPTITGKGEILPRAQSPMLSSNPVSADTR